VLEHTPSHSQEAYIAYPAKRLGGSVNVPGDKSVSHRALLLGAVAEGATKISGFLRSEDCIGTLLALRAMGVEIDDSGSYVTVNGVGPSGLKKPKMPLDLGNSGTTMRLMLGLLVAQPFDVTLIGDSSLLTRPMERVAEPLRTMGAKIVTTEGRAPIKINGGSQLCGIDYSMSVASAQLKSAILMAGLWASGRTIVRSPGISRDHTERMLETMNIGLRREGPSIVSIKGPATLSGTDIMVPRDFSSAAFFIVAGLLGAIDGLMIPAVGINPTRTGLLTILRRMGGRIELRNERSSGAEPIADIFVEKSELRAVNVDAELVKLSIDELPVLFIAASAALGRTSVRGAEELRYKECDRLAVMATGLEALGVAVEEQPDGMIVEGGTIQGGHVNSNGDHRVAMAFATASIVARGPIEIVDTAPIATSFPDFHRVATRSGFELERISYPYNV